MTRRQKNDRGDTARGQQSFASPASKGSSIAIGDADVASVRQLLFVAVVTVVGVATRMSGGNFHPVAITLVGCAIVFAVLAIADPGRLASRRLRPRTLGIAIAVATIVQCVTLFAGPLFAAGGEVDATSRTAATVALVIVALSGVTAVALRARPTRPRWIAESALAVMLVCHLISGWMTVRSAVPPMDVIVFQDLAARHWIEGGSVYAMTFPDLSGGTSPHYGPGLQAGGQLMFGFPYPPLNLLAVLPIPLLGGDYGDFRVGHAFCMTLIAAAIALSRRSTTSFAVAGLFLLTPVGPQVIVNGWTEPLVAALLALTVYLAVKRPSFAGIGLGLFWAVKQYVPLTAPLAVLLPTDGKDRSRRPALAMLLVSAVLAGALVTLPLVLPDFPAFWRSAVTLQLQQPFRDDALSFLSLVHRATGQIPPSWPSFVLLAITMALAIWRMPRSAASFAGATAATLLIFFAFSKQAFANYYYLVIAASALAAGCENPAAESEQKTTTRGVERS